MESDVFVRNGSQILFLQGVLLLVLFLMHIYWFNLIINVVVRKIFKK